jgi:hypothetical protein
MRTRWFVVGGLAAAAVAGFVLLRGPDEGPAPAAAGAAPSRAQPVPQASRRAPVKQRAGGPSDPEAGRVYINGQDLSDPSPSVKKWKEDGLPGTFREIVAPDDGVNEEERLTYRVRRMRFELNAAAAACYDGPDGTGEITLDYTLVVRAGQLVIEDVVKVGSTMNDAATEDCIVAAIRALRAPAPDVPDMRRPQGTVISQHDLYRINRDAD